MKSHVAEVQRGERFEFGVNWMHFLESLNDERIQHAEESLCDMLAVRDLHGRTFLDVGSGSGLFSLAARRLGAVVHSFDYDPLSVACTKEIKRRYRLNDARWTIEEGSVLDRDFLCSLGQFDIVYSWGVLHHTGAMWVALENILLTIAKDGNLFVAIYNDQGRSTEIWRKIKKAYCFAPKVLRPLILYPAFIRLWGPTTVRDLLKGHPGATWSNSNNKRGRGMSPWRDVIDWIGGYPFEVAKPEAIFDFYRDKGLQLRRLKTCAGGHGCNEFVFSKDL